MFLIVSVKPKYTEEEISLQQEYENIRQQLIPIMETELEAVTKVTLQFSKELLAAAPVLSKQIIDQIANTRFDTVQLIEELKTLDMSTQSGINLIIRLSNEYKVDNQTR